MKRILFGGPEDGDPHKDLVARLDDSYNVTYVNDGTGMLWELDTVRLSVDEHARPYDLVIYDSRLFWSDAAIPRRAHLFCSQVVQYLSLPKKPVIILADMDLADRIRPSSIAAGFIQFDEPHPTEGILHIVDDILHPNA